MEKRNDATVLNPNTNESGHADIAITTHGSDIYFAVTGIMAVSTIVIFALSSTKPRTQRIFHYITASITLVASIAYFTMGSNLGWAAVQVEFTRSNPRVSGVYREIMYVRYVDWFITTPLLLMDLLLTAGLPWPTILYTILIDWVMIVTGLIGALVKSRYKWGFFTFGTAAFFFVAWVVVFSARQHAAALGSQVHKTYVICGVWTIGLWTLYPIAWGLCEGGNVIAPDSEAIFYGILDVLAKPGFGALLLWGHKDINLEDLGLHVRDIGEKHAAIGQGQHPIKKGGFGGLLHRKERNESTNTGHDTEVTAAPTPPVTDA